MSVDMKTLARFESERNQSIKDSNKKKTYPNFIFSFILVQQLPNLTYFFLNFNSRLESNLTCFLTNFYKLNKYTTKKTELI